MKYNNIPEPMYDYDEGTQWGKELNIRKGVIRAMKIKSIKFVETGMDEFLTKLALVETEDNQKFVYSFEYQEDNTEWKDEEDYFDNVRSDFENESKHEDFAKDDMGLFMTFEMWSQD